MSADKPREWWIRSKASSSPSVYNHDVSENDFAIKDVVHVVEFSAYDDAIKRIDFLMNCIHEEKGLVEIRLLHEERAKSARLIQVLTVIARKVPDENEVETAMRQAAQAVLAEFEEK